MRPRPTHRYLLIEKYDLQEEARPADSKFAGFEIPEEFRKTRHEMGKLELYKVLDFGPECIGTYHVGQIVLVETHMMEVVKSVLGDFIYVGESYIPIAFVDE